MSGDSQKKRPAQTRVEERAKVAAAARATAKSALKPQRVERNKAKVIAALKRLHPMD